MLDKDDAVLRRVGNRRLVGTCLLLLGDVVDDIPADFTSIEEGEYVFVKNNRLRFGVVVVNPLEEEIVSKKQRKEKKRGRKKPLLLLLLEISRMVLTCFSCPCRLRPPRWCIPFLLLLFEWDCRVAAC
jgi:hypothetical protein